MTDTTYQVDSFADALSGLLEIEQMLEHKKEALGLLPGMFEESVSL